MGSNPLHTHGMFIVAAFSLVGVYDMTDQWQFAAAAGIALVWCILTLIDGTRQ